MAFGILGLVIGILFILIGGFLVFFFPANKEHQSGDFTSAGIFIGVLFILFGFLLLLF